MSSNGDSRDAGATTDMKGAETASVSNKDWVSLSRFEVTCQGYDDVRAPVYANGRQQVPIKILIEARDEDNVVVTVSEERLQLFLVDYDNPTSIPGALKISKDESANFVYQWTAQLSDPPQNPVICETPSMDDMTVTVGDPDARVQSFSRWVSCTKVGAIKLAAKVTSKAGVTFVSNTPNPTAGKFDSYVVIDGREPVGFPWDCFAMSGPHNATGSGNFDVDLYYIYFKDPNYRIVDSHNYREVQRGAHYAWNKDDWRMEQIAYKRSGRRLASHRSCFSADYNISFTVDDRPGQATAARISDGMGRMCSNYSYQHGLVGYIDQFGNESKVLLRAASNGNTMSLDNPSRADEVELPSDAESVSSSAKGGGGG